MTTPHQVVEAARAWLGTPWHHQGRSTAGVDCAGVCIKVAHALGESAFDVADYGRYPNNDRMRELLREHCTERFGEPLPGMIALMAFSTEPRHMGIIAPYPYGGVSIVHALARAGKVTEHRLSPEWRRRVVGLFDYRGVER